MKLEPQAIRKLLRSWCFQEVGWFALSETAARVIIELGFILGLALLGFEAVGIVFAWILFHSGAWLLLYGGYMRLWVVLGATTERERLSRFAEKMGNKVRQEAWIQTAVLRGSAAHGQLSEHSDIDVLVVPNRGWRHMVVGIFRMWSMRATSVLQRIPLQLRWVDVARYLPLLLIRTDAIILKNETQVSGGRVGEGFGAPSRRFLISFSGMDGSGKTTAARCVIATLREMGYDAAYFYGHRQAWYIPKQGRPQLSLSILVESLWKRLGRSLDEFQEHPSAKFVYDAATCVDYLHVRWKLAQLLESNAIVVSDRSVADVIVFLRALGPVYGSLEGLLVGIAHSPDIGFLFRIDPELALTRKQEHGIERLRQFASDYDELQGLLGLIPVDASLPIDVIQARVFEAFLPRLRVLLPEPDQFSPES